MTKQFAYYYDGKNSGQKKINLQYNDKNKLLILNFGKNKKLIPIKKVLLLPQLGKSIYKLQLPEGDMCEIIPNSFTDSFIKSINVNRKHDLIYKIESSSKLVILFTFLTIIMAFGTFQYGIPFAAKKNINKNTFKY